MPATKPVPMALTWMVRNGTSIVRYSPRAPRVTAPVILLGGWPGSGVAWGPLSGEGGGIASLMNRGFTVYQPFTGSNWGAQTATSPVTDGTGLKAVDDAIAQAVLDGLPTASVRLVGTSMGGLNALTYAMLNPTKIHKVHVVVPVFSIASIHSMNGGAYQSSIQGCYGGASWLANSIGRDPYRQDALVNVIASRTAIFAARDDEVIDWSLLGPWAAARGIRVTSGLGGHVFYSLDAAFDDGHQASWLE